MILFGYNYAAKHKLLRIPVCVSPIVKWLANYESNLYCVPYILHELNPSLHDVSWSGL